MQQTTKMSVCLCPKSKEIILGVSLQHILLQNDHEYKHLSSVRNDLWQQSACCYKIISNVLLPRSPRLTVLMVHSKWRIPQKPLKQLHKLILL